jgi:general stress protein CsbA
MTFELGIISFVIGAMFGGFGFKVMIVVPATLIAMLLAAMAGVVHANYFWSIIMTMILIGAAVQIGYLAGLFIRVGITSMRRH